MEESAPTASDKLFSRSFIVFVITQFLGAMNDNIFRWLVVAIGKEVITGGPKGAEGQEVLALSVGLACLTLPFLLFASFAGYCADRFSKKKVMVACKVAEIIVMSAGVLAIWYGNIWVLFALLFLMGTQSAMFSPAKYGIIPEIVPLKKITAANGVVGMMTMAAIISGTLIGSAVLFKVDLPFFTDLRLAASVLVGIATLGTLTSLFIQRVPALAPERKLRFNVVADIYSQLRVLFRQRWIVPAAVGVGFFWGVGSVLQLNINPFATNWFAFPKASAEAYSGIMLGVLTIGIGLGCVWAGLWTKGHPHLGLPPFAALGMVLCCILLRFTPAGLETVTSPWSIAAIAVLGLLGMFGGMFNVPLESYVQEEAIPETRGTVIAGLNFLTALFMFSGSGVYLVATSPNALGLNPPNFFSFIAVPLAIGVIIFARWAPIPTCLVIGEIFFKLFYKIKVIGAENLPHDQPGMWREGKVKSLPEEEEAWKAEKLPPSQVMLCPNHVSYLDALMLGMASPRYLIRMIAWEANFQSIWTRWFARIARIIPINPGNIASVKQSIRDARQALKEGDAVCIFAEGGITVDGELGEFENGFLTIRKKTGAPIVPVYIDGLWGSIFTREGGRLFWKIPKRFWPPWRIFTQFRRPITIWFGEPIGEMSSSEELRDVLNGMREELHAKKK